MECGKEGMVLREQGQGLPPSSWRLRLSLCLAGGRDHGTGPCAIFRCHLHVAPSHGGLVCRDEQTSALAPALAPSSGVDRLCCSFRETGKQKQIFANTRQVTVLLGRFCQRGFKVSRLLLTGLLGLVGIGP